MKYLIFDSQEQAKIRSREAFLDGREPDPSKKTMYKWNFKRVHPENGSCLLQIPDDQVSQLTAEETKELIDFNEADQLGFFPPPEEPFE